MWHKYIRESYLEWNKKIVFHNGIDAIGDYYVLREVSQSSDDK